MHVTCPACIGCDKLVLDQFEQCQVAISRGWLCGECKQHLGRTPWPHWTGVVASTRGAPGFTSGGSDAKRDTASSLPRASYCAGFASTLDADLGGTDHVHPCFTRGASGGSRRRASRRGRTGVDTECQRTGSAGFRRDKWHRATCDHASRVADIRRPKLWQRRPIREAHGTCVRRGGPERSSKRNRHRYRSGAEKRRGHGRVLD